MNLLKRTAGLCLMLWFGAGTCLGAAWYVDSAATGLNNGTNWANAWTTPTNIAWPSVNPGDTIYLSGGHYRDPLVVAKSGTSTGPITIRIGQDPGHNFPAVIQGLGIGNHQWITIDGSLSPSFPNPVNVLADYTITNNIGLYLTSTNGTALYMTAPVGIHVYYLGITNVIRGAAPFGYGVWGNMTTGGQTSSNVFKYCYIDTVEDDGFNWANNDYATNFNQQECGFCVIRNVGDDGLEVNHGWSVHDCIIGPSRDLHGHPDGIQSAGSYWKIYNNIFYDFLNSAMRIQMMETNTHDVYIFNNLINLGKVFVPGVPNGNVGIEIAQYASNRGEQALNTWSNIVVANNTLYTTNAAMNCGAISWDKRDENYPADFVDNIILMNSMFVNNLFYRRNSVIQNLNNGGISWQNWRTNVSWGTYPTYPNQQANVCDYNTCSGTYPGDKAITYFGTNYSSGEVMAKSSIYTNNLSTAPVFIDEGNDFNLAQGDHAALGKGTNLFWLFGFDILNRPRRSTGPWSRGAFEGQGSSAATDGLQVWLTFDDDFSDGRLDDASGNGNHAYRFGRIGSTYPTNFPVRLASNSTPGRNNPPLSDSCGKFDWYPTGYGLYGREGDYAGITNVASLTNMATASIMCWARYYRPHAGLDFSSDANETLLSAGTSAGAPGAWGFGRFNMNIWLNNTRFYVLTNGSTFQYSILEFPENGYQDDSTNWTHYAATWNNGVMIGYMNGVPFQTNDVSGAVTRLQIGTNPNNPTPWIGIGCNTHGGTPWLNDEAPNIEYPNNGWMNGVIDNVRIYSRVLSRAEIQFIYSSESGGAVVARPLPPMGLHVVGVLSSGS